MFVAWKTRRVVSGWSSRHGPETCEKNEKTSPILSIYRFQYERVFLSGLHTMEKRFHYVRYFKVLRVGKYNCEKFSPRERRRDIRKIKIGRNTKINITDCFWWQISRGERGKRVVKKRIFKCGIVKSFPARCTRSGRKRRRRREKELGKTSQLPTFYIR